MRVAVIDGQGGGIGKTCIDRIRKAFGGDLEILALGTNATASAVMLKAGANEAATGENAIVQNVGRVDVIVGTIAVVMAHSMMGEMTPAMAEVIAASPALKLLLPLNRCNVQVIGATLEPLPHIIERLIERLRIEMEAQKNV